MSLNYFNITTEDIYQILRFFLLPFLTLQINKAKVDFLQSRLLTFGFYKVFSAEPIFFITWPFVQISFMIPEINH